MCGIIGIVGNQNVTTRLLEGLKRLEYRGYDSAGVAVLSNSTSPAQLVRRRAEGKIVNLVNRIDEEPIDGHLGLPTQDGRHTALPTKPMPILISPAVLVWFTTELLKISPNYATVLKKSVHSKLKQTRKWWLTS